MRTPKTLALVVLTLVVASGAETFPWLWGTLQSAEDLKYIGSLKPYETDCTVAVPFGECRKMYYIPADVLKSKTGKPYEAIGLGFFLTDYLARCENKRASIGRRDIPPSLILDAYKVYKIVDLNALQCRKHEGVEILAINKKGFATHGQISSNAVIGKRDEVGVFKRAVEFFAVGVYVIVFLILGFSFLVRRRVLGQFLSQESESESALLLYGLPWALFALFKSGILEILFLKPSSIDFMFRVQTGISVVAHAFPMLAYLSAKYVNRSRRKPILTVVLLVAYAPFAFSQYFNYYLICVTLALGLVTTPLALFRRSFVIAIFSAFTILEDFKALGLVGMPNGSTTLIFIACIHMTDIISAIRRTGILASANLWLKQKSLDAEMSPDLRLVLNDFCLLTKVQRVTYLDLQDSTLNRLIICDLTGGSGIEDIVLESVPPLFAQVISTRSPLRHVQATNKIIEGVLRRNPIIELGEYFSISPLISSDRVVGAIAISKYMFSPHTSEESSFKLDAFISALENAVLVTRRREIAISSDSRFNRLLQTLPQTIDSKRWSSLEEAARELLRILDVEFGWKGFVGILSDSSGKLDIVASTFLSGKGDSILRRSAWAMDPDNMRGPGPLAIFQNKRLLIPKVEWVLSSYADRTIEFIEVSESKSLCVVPLRKYTGEKFASFGLLWIASSRDGDFDSAFDRSAILLQEMFEKALSRIFQYTIEATILTGTLRPDIHSRLMKGENPVDEGVGLLIQVDLAGSTKMAGYLGDAKWKNFQKDYLDIAREIGERLGLTAEIFVWDAVYFTANAQLHPQSLLSLYVEVEDAVKELHRRHGVIGLFDPGQNSIRVCATYGDITREIRHGSWTVTGQSMAQVSKMEQSIKGCAIAIACSGSLYDQWRFFCRPEDLSVFRAATPFWVVPTAVFDSHFAIDSAA